MISGEEAEEEEVEKDGMEEPEKGGVVGAGEAIEAGEPPPPNNVEAVSAGGWDAEAVGDGETVQADGKLAPAFVPSSKRWFEAEARGG